MKANDIKNIFEAKMQENERNWMQRNKIKN